MLPSRHMVCWLALMKCLQSGQTNPSSSVTPQVSSMNEQLHLYPVNTSDDSNTNSSIIYAVKIFAILAYCEDPQEKMEVYNRGMKVRPLVMFNYKSINQTNAVRTFSATMGVQTEVVAVSQKLNPFPSFVRRLYHSPFNNQLLSHILRPRCGDSWWREGYEIQSI